MPEFIYESYVINGEVFKNFRVRVEDPTDENSWDYNHYLHGKLVAVSIANTAPGVVCEFIIDGRSYIGYRPYDGVMLSLRELANTLHKVNLKVVTE